jgi:hypothetical protein
VAVYGKNGFAGLVIYRTTPLSLGQGAAPVTGTIASVGTNVLTLTLPDGTLVTVELSPTTTYLFRGRKLPAPPSLTIGLRIQVTGKTQVDGTIVASRIVIEGG